MLIGLIVHVFNYEIMLMPVCYFKVFIKLKKKIKISLPSDFVNTKKLKGTAFIF